MSEHLCECGCGQPTPIAKNTDRKYGWVKGQPKRFAQGHNSKTGKMRPIGIVSDGPADQYRTITVDHQSAGEHIVVAERALGRPLARATPVHHVNGNRRDNRPCNLVICESQSYHELLHVRQAALDACGNANWRRCYHCKQYDDPSRLHIGKGQAYHRPCNLAYQRERLWRKQREEVGLPLTATTTELRQRRYELGLSQRRNGSTGRMANG
jgi:hypothetical protein